MTDISELKELERKLAELKRLPEIERQAQAQAQKEQSQQNLVKYESDLELWAAKYHALCERIDQKKSDLLSEIDTILADIKELSQVRKDAEIVSKHVGQTRCKLGQGIWGNTGQILPGDIDHESQVALTQNGIDVSLTRYGQLSAALLALRQQVTPPKPKSPLQGKVQIVKGETQYWG